MSNYWFQYNTTTGVIYPYKQDVSPSTGPQMGVLGPYPADTAPTDVVMAYVNSERYRAVNGQLVLQPYFSLAAASTAEGDYTFTATLNNPPSSAPTSCRFTIAGTDFTAALTDGKATLQVKVHAAVADRINVQVASDGCVGVQTTIGGMAESGAVQAYQAAGESIVRVAPTTKLTLVQHYMQQTNPAYTIADLGAGQGILMQAVFGIILPALTSGTTPLVTLDQNQQNAARDIVANLLPNIVTMLENAAPVPQEGQVQSYDIHYKSLTDDMAVAKQAYDQYVTDVLTIPNLS